MTTRHHHAVANGLISGALALGVCVGGAVPAGAEPDEVSVGPTPDSPAQQDIERGIRDGLSARMPGLPPPPTEPRA